MTKPDIAKRMARRAGVSQVISNARSFPSSRTGCSPPVSLVCELSGRVHKSSVRLARRRVMLGGGRNPAVLRCRDGADDESSRRVVEGNGEKDHVVGGPGRHECSIPAREDWCPGACLAAGGRALIVNIASVPVLYLGHSDEAGLRARTNMLASRPRVLDCPAINRILAAGQRQGSTSAIRTAINALVAN